MSETHLRARRQTIKLGMMKVAKDLFPDETLWFVYSIGEGVYCRLEKSALSIREVELLETKVREWVVSNPEITYLGKKGGYFQYKVGGMVFDTIYEADTNVAVSEKFRMIPFEEGFISDHSVEEKGFDYEFVLPELLSSTYHNNHNWLRNINLESVADLNEYIEAGRAIELQNIAEALQEKQMADIADMILSQRRSLRLILISGPSSSGKTTFAGRLSTQLRVNGLKPVPLSMDNYFINREVSPKDKDGNYDFETIKTLDLELLQDQVIKLINGERVETPGFDFITGNRMPETVPMQLGNSDILVMEGIHALNPKLLPKIGKSTSFKVYVSALFGLNVDLSNRIPTTEVRMLRRMVRDGRERGVSPEDTLDRWPSVRRGETEYVFKYQEQADVMFNSSLLYELNAIRPFAEELLVKIDEASPHFETRERLMNLLSFFKPIDISKIPFNSIVREFIGQSICK
jgi:uridine kinase